MNKGNYIAQIFFDIDNPFIGPSFDVEYDRLKSMHNLNKNFLRSRVIPVSIFQSGKKTLEKDSSIIMTIIRCNQRFFLQLLQKN